MARPLNILFLLGESHAAGLMGCAGHPVIRTPNLNRLAARGTMFDAAWCGSPLCVPARAAIATGRLPHDTGYWDSSMAYDGRMPGWMGQLRDAGYETMGIGKMHFRSQADDFGFSRSAETMHIAEGIGDLVSALRYEGTEPTYPGLWEIWTSKFGSGHSPYRDYDERITATAESWLKDAPADQPWSMSVHFISAHAPFVTPPGFFGMYDRQSIPEPVRFRRRDRPDHPTIRHLRRIMCHADDLPRDQVLAVRAAYFATVSYLDSLVGRVLAALQATGQADNTLIVYTSDHGFGLGDHYLFGLFHMFEEALRVPLLMAGPGVPAGQRITAPVSHIDLAPTLLQTGGAMMPGGCGHSLWPLMAGRTANRGPVLAEYHGTGTRSGGYALRDGAMKLIHFVGETPQLFDLSIDPEEAVNLAGKPEMVGELNRMQTELHKFLDPEQVDLQAKAAQRDLIADHGGKTAVLQKMGGFSYSPPPGIDWRDMEGNRE